jgi:ketosteroid isomerase-like protein
MTAVRVLSLLWLSGLAGCTSGQSLRTPETFDTDQIRLAERCVTAAFTAPDVTSWVSEYTEDALLLAPSAPPVTGRVELFELARSMKPITSATIHSDRIEGSGNVAYSYGTAI